MFFEFISNHILYEMSLKRFNGKSLFNNKEQNWIENRKKIFTFLKPF